MINQEWEESEVFRYLSEQRFLLQIFVEEEKGYVYAGHLFLKIYSRTIRRMGERKPGKI